MPTEIKIPNVKKISVKFDAVKDENNMNVLTRALSISCEVSQEVAEHIIQMAKLDASWKLTLEAMTYRQPLAGMQALVDERKGIESVTISSGEKSVTLGKKKVDKSTGEIMEPEPART